MTRALRNYKHVDYSGLLRELNHRHEEDEQRSSITDAASAERLPKTTRREILLRNKQMRYAYSVEQAVFHDRDCPCIKNISDKNFRVSEVPPEHREFCPVCFRRAIVRMAVPQIELKHFELFMKLLDTFGAEDKDLETLVIDHKAQMYKAEPNAVYIRVREDSWFIRETQGNLYLFHNNYLRTECSKRIMGTGFHRQLKCVNFHHAVLCVCNYSWEEHAKYYEREAQRAQLRERLQTSSNYSRKRCISPVYTYYYVVDYGAELESLLQNKNIKYRVKKRQQLDPQCSLVLCGVLRRKRETIAEVAEIIRDRCIDNLCLKYADYCSEKIKQNK